MICLMGLIPLLNCLPMMRHFPKNTPRVFHVETTWKRLFPVENAFNLDPKKPAHEVIFSRKKK